MLTPYYRCSFFFLALSLFPGTEKREFDYVCITESFKSFTVLNCAKNRLRETCSQTAKGGEQQRREEERAQSETHIFYYYIYFLFPDVNKVRDIS